MMSETPRDWPKKRLRFCLKLNPSKQEIRHLPKDTEVSFIPMEAVGEDGSLDLSETRRIEDVESGYTFFRNSDVAIAKITPCFENGKGSIFRGLVNEYGFGTTELTVMRPEYLVPEFLYYLTISYRFRVTGIGLMQGSAGQKRIPDDYIKNYVIGLPSDEEQQAIASFLDRETARIDDLIQKQERMIELLKEKRIALITQAVTKGLDPNAKMKDSGIEWLGEVPEHWEVKRLRYCLKLNPSKNEIRHLPKETELSFIPMESVGVDGSIDLYETKPIEDVESGYTYFSNNDVAIAKITPCFENGKGCIFRELENGYGFGSTELTVMRPLAISSDFLYYITVSSYFRKTGVALMQGSAGQKRVPDNYIKNLSIGLPTLDEQRRVVQFIGEGINRIDALIDKTQNSVELLREYRASLIHHAVTGKIDLRDYDVPTQ